MLTILLLLTAWWTANPTATCQGIFLDDFGLLDWWSLKYIPTVLCARLVARLWTSRSSLLQKWCSSALVLPNEEAVKLIWKVVLCDIMQWPIKSPHFWSMYCFSENRGCLKKLFEVVICISWFYIHYCSISCPLDSHFFWFVHTGWLVKFNAWYFMLK